MAERITKYYQKCDFCHKEYLVPESGLMRIVLPGYDIGEYGAKHESIIGASICNDCLDRIRKILAEKVDIKDIAYGGVCIHWKEGDDNDGAGNGK